MSAYVTELYRAAVEKFGPENQQWMAVEEIGELITAINAHRQGRANRAAVATEIADAQIVMNQLAVIFGESSTDFSEKSFPGMFSDIGNCGEAFGRLLTCLSHHRRGRIPRDDVAEAVALVRIALEQLAAVYGPGMVRRERAAKIARLREQLR